MAAVKTIRVCIDGRIGAGKTTLIENVMSLLQKDEDFKLPIHCFVEPVEEWNTAVGDDIALWQVYQDMHNGEKQAAFQLKVLTSLVTRENQILKKTGLILEERSIFHSLTFIKTLQKEGKLSNQVALQLINLVTAMSAGKKNDINIYLDAATDLLIARILLRDRVGEWFIGEDFLNSLNEFKVVPPSHLNVDIDTTRATPEEIAKRVVSLVKNTLKHI